jgi:hypothetical protein
MRLRGSTIVMLTWGVLLLACAGCLVHAGLNSSDRSTARELTSRLGLTDTALFNEARYTRHPALGDLSAAFQDGPASLDHFPSGSLLPPPRRVQSGQIRLTAP